MAQALLAQRLTWINVLSAGLGALIGQRADPLAIELMAERNLDISRHVAISLNLQHVRDAQLVLTMTRAQADAIKRKYPFANGRVYRLGERQGRDIPDPYGQPRCAFELALSEIELSVKWWSDRLERVTL